MELTTENAPAWLRAHGFPCDDVFVSELGGGVSNNVLLAEESNSRIVLKQSLGTLRVAETWLSSRDRILREASAMRWLSDRVKGGRIPRVFSEDADNFTIAMEAAPPGAEMWKTRLLRGQLDTAPARAAGALLASVISISWNNPQARELFHDQTVFEQLRIDPYYRFTATRHPAAAEYILGLIVRSAERRQSLVHGDWSPKNLLVAGAELWAIDWEVTHFGDPSFDVAFLWTHLLLKSIARPTLAPGLAKLALTFTEALRAGLQFQANSICDAALEHVPALLLARVDGKSPAEYLDSAMQNQARAKAFNLMSQPAASILEIFER